MGSENIQPQQLTEAVRMLMSEYGWVFATGVVALLLQSSIRKFVASIFVFWGNDYKTDDVVYVDGKPGRIIRVGLTKTVFFIYDVVDGAIVGGSKLVVQNERLMNIKIEKPLPQLDLSRFNKNKKD